MADEVRLVLQAPGRDAPGFLRRQRAVVAFQRRIAADNRDDALAALSDLADWLVDFVVEPADRAAAYEALLDASQAQLEAAMLSIANPTPPPPASGGSSDAG
jgi:hypothetical protein